MYMKWHCVYMKQCVYDTVCVIHTLFHTHTVPFHIHILAPYIMTPYTPDYKRWRIGCLSFSFSATHTATHCNTGEMENRVLVFLVL